MPMPVLSWWVFSETNKNPVWSVCPVLGYSRFFGEVAEWFKAAVLKTVDGQPSGGSNPSLSANSAFIGLFPRRLPGAHDAACRDGMR